MTNDWQPIESAPDGTENVWRDHLKRRNIDRFCEPCPHCGTIRERHIDLITRRYQVLMPTSCATKEKCEAELMSGFEIEPDLPQPPTE